MPRQLTVTALTHPTMIAKIRSALYYAHKGQGNMMQGHGKRCYIQNAQGRNIMRLDWVGGKVGYIVYGNESVNITGTVRKALALVAKADKPTVKQDSYKVEHTQRHPKQASRVGKLATVVGMTFALTACMHWVPI